MSSLRIGIVGCGGIAHHHMRGYKAAGADVVKVYDASESAAKAFATSAELPGDIVAKSLEEMLDAGLDAVSVCTPPGTHLACCEPFLRRRVAVLCEKPLEATLAAARRLTTIVHETRSLFQIGFCHRFHGPVIEVKRLIDQGVLGRPLLFRNIFGGWLPLTGNHRIDPQLSGGGVLADNGAHAVDLFRYLFGDPALVVSAMTANLAQDLPVEDYGSIELLHDGPDMCVAGQVVSSYSLRAGANQFEVFGTHATAIVNYGNTYLPECAYRPCDSDDWIPVPHAHHAQRFIGEIKHFLDRVLTPAAVAVDATAHDGLRAAELIDAAYRSAASAKARNAV